MRRTKKFCEINTLVLYYVITDKSMVEILQNFGAFSEYMNFTLHILQEVFSAYAS